jgi:hypothetical protein
LKDQNVFLEDQSLKRSYDSPEEDSLKIGSDVKNLYNLRICAMCLVGYAGFLRYNEIANLKMCNLNIFDTYISLNIESSKTDTLYI